MNQKRQFHVKVYHCKSDEVGNFEDSDCKREGGSSEDSDAGKEDWNGKESKTN